MEEYKKLKERLIKNSFDPVAKDTCLWSKEKAFRLIDYHFNTWRDIHGSILEVYKALSWKSLLFLFFNSLFKEIYWIQLLFLWGNYRVIGRNLRFILEEIALGSNIDRKFPNLDLDSKMKKADDIYRKTYGWNLLQSVLAEMGIKKNSQLKTIKETFWDLFHEDVHPKPIRLLEISQIDPKSTVRDSFNEDLAEECLARIDASFDLIYSIVIYDFPDIVEELRKKKRFTDKTFKDLSPLSYSLISE